MLRRLYILFLIAILGLSSQAQQLSGTWRGWDEKKFGMTPPVSITLRIEQINDSLFTGVLDLKYTRGRYEHTKVSAKYNAKDSSFIMVEDSVISLKKSVFESTCLGKSTLKLVKTDTSLLLVGKWKDKSSGLFKCPKMNIGYEKKNTETVAVTKAERYNDIQRVVDLKRKNGDSVKIEIYDNAVVDNDSVNVYLNDKPIVTKMRLNATPQVVYFNLDKTKDVNFLKLEAINLGEVEPNTALVLITINKKEYSMTLSSSFQKNGVVQFQFTD
jgi:hypothetical protein